MAFCDRNCNVITPFVTAPENRNETILLAPAISILKSIVKQVGLDLKGSTMSLDGVYNSRTSSKATHCTPGQTLRATTRGRT